MDLIPVQDKPLNLALKKMDYKQQNGGCTERFKTSSRSVCSVSSEKKVPTQEREKPEFEKRGLPIDMLQSAKKAPQRTEGDSDPWFEVGCDSTATDSRVWLPARKRKHFREPFMEQYLKTLPFKKRICLMMKMAEGSFP